jgi:hypothetical protein
VGPYECISCISPRTGKCYSFNPVKAVISNIYIEQYPGVFAVIRFTVFTLQEFSLSTTSVVPDGFAIDLFIAL